MEKIVRQSYLFDFYGELLTQHQKNIYSQITEDDLSYSEVARIEGISRQGVFDLVKRCDKILEEYEDKLHLVEKFLHTKSMVAEIKQQANDIQKVDLNASLLYKIEKIEEISNAILEEY